MPEPNERKDAVARELERGRKWRAKEILRGRVAQGFDRETYSAYGDLLLELGDTFEAGKYLFLCGRDDDASAEAVRLFLHRHRKRKHADFMAQLPAGARGLPLESYPDPVRAELERRGYRGPRRKRSRRESTWRGRAMTAGALLFVVFVLVCAVLGFLRLFGL